MRDVLVLFSAFVREKVAAIANVSVQTMSPDSGFGITPN